VYGFDGSDQVQTIMVELRRFSEHEGDHQLHAALERMRVDHPHLWEVLYRLHLSRDADPSKLEEWRRAPKNSQEGIWAGPIMTRPWASCR
jgi:hypothetical protein